VLAAAAAVVLTIFGRLLDMLGMRVAEGASERIGTELRATMFERAMTRSPSTNGRKVTTMSRIIKPVMNRGESGWRRKSWAAGAGAATAAGAVGESSPPSPPRSLGG
jgi:hypothetical protein